MSRAEPRWLDDAQQAWLRLLRVVMLLPGALDRQLRQDAATAPGHVAKVRDLFDPLTRDDVTCRSSVAGRLVGRLEADHGVTP